MAEDSRRAIQEALIADTGAEGLGALGLSQYAGALAVFAQDRVPENAAFPYIVISAAIAATDFDTKTRGGAEEFHDVVIADSKNVQTPPVRIDRLARRARKVLHRAPLAIDGANVIRVRAIPPVDQESSEDVASRVVSVSILYQGPANQWQ